MRLQIPAHSPLAFLTLVGACGGTQTTDGPVAVTLTSLQCDGDELGDLIVEGLLEHGFVNTSHLQAGERSAAWLAETRSELDRLARRLTPPPGSGFGSDTERSGIILAVVDSELTDTVELLLLTAWNDEPMTPLVPPDPVGIVGHTAAVLQCTAAGIWEPVAHHDLSLPYTYLNMVGMRTSDTPQGIVHTLILQDLDPYMYDQSVFDFAILLGNERAHNQPREIGPYAYTYDDPFSEWGPLTYLGQFYSLGYDVGYHAGPYAGAAELLDASDWFPLNGVVSDPDSYDYSPYTAAFLALHYKAYFGDVYDGYYDGYYDYDYPEIDPSIGTYGIIGALNSDLELSGFGAVGVFGGSVEDELYGGLVDSAIGDLMLEAEDYLELYDEGYDYIGTAGRGAGISGLGTATTGGGDVDDEAAMPEVPPPAEEYVVDELYLEYLTNLPEMQPPDDEDDYYSGLMELLAEPTGDGFMLPSFARYPEAGDTPAAQISLTAVGGIGPDSFTAFAPSLLPAFVLLVSREPRGRCDGRTIHCRSLSPDDQARFARTELAATMVVGSWIDWRDAAAAAERLGLADDEYLIVGPDLMMDDQYWTAYFGDQSVDWTENPEELNQQASEIHPRLRVYVLVVPDADGNDQN